MFALWWPETRTPVRVVRRHGKGTMNISVALTEEQVLRREKDVTRRMAWLKLKPGGVLQPVRKGQGLKKGETATKVGGPIRVISVTREPLCRLLDDQVYGLTECVREGFPGLTPQQFVTFFMASHDCTIDAIVTRIEFTYVDQESKS